MRLKLRITSAGRTDNKEWDEIAVVTLGRNTDVALADNEVSRIHATIYQTPEGELRIKDEKSTNGTFVSGKPISDERLELGSVITLGDSTIEVTLFESSSKRARTG